MRGEERGMRGEERWMRGEERGVRREERGLRTVCVADVHKWRAADGPPEEGAHRHPTDHRGSSPGETQTHHRRRRPGVHGASQTTHTIVTSVGSLWGLVDLFIHTCSASLQAYVHSPDILHLFVGWSTV